MTRLYCVTARQGQAAVLSAATQRPRLLPLGPGEPGVANRQGDRVHPFRRRHSLGQKESRGPGTQARRVAPSGRDRGTLPPAVWGWAPHAHVCCRPPRHLWKVSPCGRRRGVRVLVEGQPHVAESSPGDNAVIRGTPPQPAAPSPANCSVPRSRPPGLHVLNLSFALARSSPRVHKRRASEHACACVHACYASEHACACVCA